MGLFKKTTKQTVINPNVKQPFADIRVRKANEEGIIETIFNMGLREKQLEAIIVMLGYKPINRRDIIDANAVMSNDDMLQLRIDAINQLNATVQWPETSEEIKEYIENLQKQAKTQKQEWQRKPRIE